MSGLRFENNFFCFVHLAISPFAASATFLDCFHTTSSPKSLSKKETNHQNGTKFRITTSLLSSIANINLIGFLEIFQVRFPHRGQFLVQFLKVRFPNRRPNKASEKEEPNRKPTISNIRPLPRIPLLPNWKSS
jgi:hypothetical protein